MALSVRCPACGKGHKGSERAAGQTLACLNCGGPITFPSPEPIDPAAILLATDDVPPAALPAIGKTTAEGEIEETQSAKPPKQARPVDVAKLRPLTTNDPPLWRRHLHWLLLLALLPLVTSLLIRSEEKSIVVRVNEYVDQLDDDERERLMSRIERAESLDEVLTSLPGEKLQGAFLRRSSMGQLLMAALAAMLYLTFFMFLASDGSANPVQVLLAGLFTATIGIAFLLLVQLIASSMGGRMPIGKSVLVLILYVLKFIAFSYSAAADPENGFLLSFLGFTCGVGLCEELVKTIPLFWHRHTDEGKEWRGLFIWGLASGAGFGIAEGIIYSSRYYNGIMGPGIYLVRFCSCVALHAIWTGSVAILLYQRRDLFEKSESWAEWVFPTLFVVAVPAFLHGLYDTCLKKDMNGMALLSAFASFGYLAFLLSRHQSHDDEAAQKEMLKEYKRRRKAMS